ncbi:MAG: hypothetical protein M3R63_22645 [Actinomycetota bacterium]|nr:hypothetical protein [Actinomycetota bacterium]
MSERDTGERVAAALRAQASIVPDVPPRSARDVAVGTLLLAAVSLGAAAGVVAALVSTL